MRNLEVISQSPNANIKYIVRMKGDTVADMLVHLAKKLREREKLCVTYVTIFAKSYEACGDVRIHLRSSAIILKS